jgi:hypothetical protein
VPWLPLPISGAAMAKCSFGLAPAELVLRGGGLSSPIILTGLKEMEGSLFYPLRHDHGDFNQFLCGRKHLPGHVAKSPAFAAVARARNAARIAALKAALQPADAEGSPDMVEDLGLDEGGCSAVRFARSARKAQVPVAKIAAVELPMEGSPPWRPRVLLEPSRCSPAIEATPENFDNFRELFLASGFAEHRAEASGFASPSAPEAVSPRGPPGAREYFHKGKQRWVRYQKCDHAVVPTSLDVPVDTDNTKKQKPIYRYLVRRPSGPTEHAPKAKKLRRRASAEHTPAALQDCLTDFPSF